MRFFRDAIKRTISDGFGHGLATVDFRQEADMAMEDLEEGI